MTRRTIQWFGVFGIFWALAAVGCSNGALDVEPAGEEAKDRYEKARERMVERQLQGIGRDIKDPRVLAVMKKVPRHEFVPEGQREMAYGDHPLPIGYGQTISQPYIVAYMTQALEPEPTDRVLEIGTGSGYQAAVLGELVEEVYSIEIVEGLAKGAEETLERLGYENVHVKHGDGYKGWPEMAPFDTVIVTAAPDDVPEALVEQLAEGGRMIIPIGPAGGMQTLYILEKEEGEVKQRDVFPVRFVPMTGGGEE